MFFFKYLGEVVQKMWKNLCDKYGKERRALRNVPSGAAAPESINMDIIINIIIINI